MYLLQIRNIALVLTLVFLAAVPLRAQQSRPDADRDRIFTELRAYKHKVLVESLDLTKEQQREFFPVYDEMDDKLIQINNETRDLERSVIANPDATDTEIEAAAAAVYSQKEREGEVEMEYYDKLKQILTPRQLLCLRSAEKNFTQKLVRYHRRLRDEPKQK